MLKGVFSMDSPLFQFLNKTADMLILNLLFIVCCFPIITIGASLTALSYVTQKMKAGEDGYIVRSFFKSFRQNFRQATAIWLLLLVWFLLLVGDYLILNQMQARFVTPMRVVIFVGGVFWLLVVMYAFPLLAKFENTVFGTLRNALLLALGNAPKALLTVVIFVGSIVLTAWNMNTITWGILIWLMFGFAIHSYINSAMQYTIFHRFIPEEETGEEDPDNWVLDDTPDRQEETAGDQAGRQL